MASQIMLSSMAMILTVSFITLVHAQETSLVSGPSDQSVEQFSPVKLGCSVANIKLAEEVVSWAIGDTVISNDGRIDPDAMEDLFGPGHSDRYEIIIGVKQPVYSIDLNITSAQGVENGREFKCVLCGRNADNECDGRFKLESNSATLEVNYRPDIETYPLCNSNLPNSDIPRNSDRHTIILLGQPAILNCTSETAKPSVELSWLQDGSVLGDDTTLHESNGFSHLEHRFTAELSHSGVAFTCLLRSEYFNLGRGCILAPIKVVSYPTVTIESPGAISAGRTHEFVCKASSNTSIAHSYTYHWTYDPTFSKPQVNTTKYGSVLSTNALSDDDGDEIRCTVTDSDGLVSYAVTRIDIKGELSIGAIVGIAAAGVCFIGFICLLVFLVVRKKKKDKKRKEKPLPPTAVPMLPSSLKSANDV